MEITHTNNTYQISCTKDEFITLGDGIRNMLGSSIDDRFDDGNGFYTDEGKSQLFQIQDSIIGAMEQQRKLDRLQSVKIKVSRQDDEWVAKYYDCIGYREELSYFSGDDKEDAEQTAEAMRQEVADQIQKLQQEDPAATADQDPDTVHTYDNRAETYSLHTVDVVMPESGSYHTNPTWLTHKDPAKLLEAVRLLGVMYWQIHCTTGQDGPLHSQPETLHQMDLKADRIRIRYEKEQIRKADAINSMPDVIQVFGAPHLEFRRNTPAVYDTNKSREVTGGYYSLYQASDPADSDQWLFWEEFITSKGHIQAVKLCRSPWDFEKYTGEKITMSQDPTPEQITLAKNTLIRIQTQAEQIQRSRNNA